MRKYRPRRHSVEIFLRKRDEFRTKANHDLSSEDIGEDLDVTPKTIRKWAKEYNITLGPSRMEREKATKRAALIGSSYIVDGWATISLSKLGRYFGVCSGTVAIWLAEEGIEACANLPPWAGKGLDARDDLPAEAVFLARHLEAWGRNPELDDVVWPIIAKRKWHDSAHHQGKV